ncbi:hypothetical protein LOD99_2335 [Oopsacas minuta]|uniref:Translin-associated factor X-interacting protein 1 N-terminal domain-containing protein n=1 Tax=Oopsacas minuta TaxID=111878 RepID=A0AAV7K424_9METZ|nr:hypothetical protein LOD99_2335 [Oopsacas minuta]
MFPNIPLTYRDKEKESSKLDNIYIDRKNILHTSSSLNSTPHSRDVQAHLTDELNHIPNDDIVGRLDVARKYFSDILEHTTTHQHTLQGIKSVYENILFSEEDKLTNERTHPSPLSHSVTTIREEIEKSHNRLAKKEAELYKLYYDNIKLQEELKDEISSIRKLETQNRRESKEDQMLILPILSSHTSLINLPQKEQVEKLHIIYHEQDEVLSDVKDELKRKYVPAAECKYVEMCINDVEVIIQKEKRVKESLNEHLNDLVQQISSLLSEIPFSPQKTEMIMQSLLSNTSLQTE